MKKIAAYLRVSTEDQAERGTIEAQRDFATKYCDLHQLGTPVIYADDGVTGTMPLEDRPEGARLLGDIRAGMIDTVFIYKLDRLGRSARITLNAVHSMEMHGVKIRSMTEPFDTADAGGRFLLTILAGAADLDRSSTLERLWNGANRAAKDHGRWLGGIVPYGYKKVDKFLEIDEQESAIVAMMYEKVAGGMSCVKLADYMNANNIPTAYTNGHGKRKIGTTGIWTPGRVRNLLVSTIYYGHHEYGRRTNKKRETIARTMPSIVSKEVWDQCQQQIIANRVIEPHNRKHDYLLRGLVKCGQCGLNYSGFNYKGKIQDFYRCNGKSKYRGPIHGTCPSPNVPAKQIDTAVWERIESFFANPGKELDVLRENAKTDIAKLSRLENEKKALQSAIDGKAFEREIIIDMARKRVITQDEATNQLEKLSAEKTMLQSQLAAIDHRMHESAVSADDFASIELMLAEMKGTITDFSFAEKMDLVKKLVSSIIVSDRDGRTHIEVNYKFVAHNHTDNLASKCYTITESYTLAQRYSKKQAPPPATIPDNGNMFLTL